jgi:dTDP-glucose 4,6-dehydratase
LKLTGQPEQLLQHVTDRPGHDRRYAMDYGKLAQSHGWEPQVDLEDGLEQTVRWYMEHKTWWEMVKSGQYLEYYRRHYENRS